MKDMSIFAPYGYFAPEQAASSYIWTNLHEDFAKNGFDCDIYTPIPTRGISTDVRQEYATNKKYEIWFDGKLKINRFALWNEPKSTIGRFIRYFAQCGLLYLKMFYGKKKQYNVIFSASTPPIMGATSALIKRHLGIPFVYSLQDIFPDSLVGTGLAKKGGLLWKIGRVIEDFTYRNADKIIVISEDFKKNIMAKGVPEDKIVVVYNWVDQNAVVPIEKNDNPLFEEFGLSRERFHVVYAGNLGNAQNIHIIVDAAARLRHNVNVDFVVFGSGGIENEIRNRIEAEGLNNLRLLPLQPVERVKYVYSLGDVCLVCCKEGLGGSAMPSKTWSILSSGRPVLANFDEGELQMILTKNELGVFTKAGDLDGFVEAIEGLASEPQKCAAMGARGRQFVMGNLTREVGTQKYVDVIKSVVAEAKKQG